VARILAIGWRNRGGGPVFLMAIASIIGGWVLSIEFGFALVLIFSAWSLLTDG
jgi:hypothetical protein